jgi:hypothetical protein
MAVRIQFRRGTAAEWTSANPTLAAGEVGYEVDTAQIKIGNGSSTWTSLPYAAVSASYVENAIANVVGLSPESLDTLNELAAAINDDDNFFSTVANNIANAEANAIDYTNEQITLHNVSTNIHGITDTTQLVYNSTLEDYSTILYVDESILDHSNVTTNVHGIANTALLVDTADLGLAIDNHNSDTTDVHGIANTANLVYQSEFSGHTGDSTDVHGISNTANLVYQSELVAHTEDTINVHGISDTADLVYSGDLLAHTSETTNVHGIADTALLVTDSSLQTTLEDYAPLLNPSFTGTVVLPADTSIGDVSGTELGYLNGVTSSVQTQLNAKLSTTSAESIYAKLEGATFTGNVVLTANTSIGSVDSTEIGYLNGVTSGIQTQLDAKAPTANPTFTGTVSGVTKGMVGLGDVDNTSDLDKPISNATQTALDLKANISSPVFTGEVETADLTVTGNLFVQGTTTTVSASDLKLRDNMIYLNQAGLSVITAAVHGSGNTVFTTEDAHGYQAGDYVTIDNTTPSSFNISGDGVEILAVTTNTFTITATTADTYISGGTVRGKVHFNPDLGWAAGRYADNTYAHAGLFRDATDGVFKFFDGYTPEPDESVFIDTAHNTFALADVAVADLKTSNAIIFADNTVQTSAGVPSLTQFVEKTSNYTLDTLSLIDEVIEVNSSSATTITIPTNATLAWPVGASMDILQTGTGQVTIANAVGVTLNFTPGNKLRTRWSSCTIMKRGTDSWILYGDLTA